MSHSASELESEEQAEKYRLAKQRSIQNESWFSKLLDVLIGDSFDKISLGLVGTTIGIGLVVYASNSGSLFEIRGSPVLITITLMSAVFTLLSVRESKRDRETNVAPALFIAKRDEEYGIVNIGNGPAHELSVKVSEHPRDSWDSIPFEREGRVLRVNQFLPLESGREVKRVRMDYSSNLGKEYSNITREALSGNEG